ncbi:hypothetical protein IB256_18265 [Pseudomonas sp. PDM17]|uniref:hypothetical protein n=1 Tax=Pseudomonas sp. PDM17 TaxID=2769285 RepID=UPI001786AFEB|nr:hypothetical protein [Pseudomonas sp. PDM17]MBD9502741.1 hypothetical protein [Pseudomonas sp. PDM17]
MASIDRCGQGATAKAERQPSDISCFHWVWIDKMKKTLAISAVWLCCTFLLVGYTASASVESCGKDDQSCASSTAWYRLHGLEKLSEATGKLYF